MTFCTLSSRVILYSTSECGDGCFWEFLEDRSDIFQDIQGHYIRTDQNTMINLRMRHNSPRHSQSRFHKAGLPSRMISSNVSSCFPFSAVTVSSTNVSPVLALVALRALSKALATIFFVTAVENARYPDFRR